MMSTQWSISNLPRKVSVKRHRISNIGYFIHQVIREAPRDFFWISRRSEGTAEVASSENLFCSVKLFYLRSYLVSNCLYLLLYTSPSACVSNSLRLSKCSPWATCQIASPSLRMTATNALNLGLEPSRCTLRRYQAPTTRSR